LVDYNTWSIASATSVAWVIVAYILNVADTPLDSSVNMQSDGEATGSMWLWLIPIAVGWLQLSPKCNFDRSQAAYDRADRHTRTRDSHIVSSPASTPRALITANKEDVTSPDDLLTPPVFNYSRSLQWSSEAETAFQVLKVALQKAQSCIPVRFGRSGSSPTLSRPFTLAICVGLPVKSPRTVPCQKVHSAAIGRLGCSQE
jgi:hypothetical protein